LTITSWPRLSRLMLPPFKLSRLVLNLEDGLHYHYLLVIPLVFYFPPALFSFFWWFVLNNRPQ
jgi:hypothetical protein